MFNIIIGSECLWFLHDYNKNSFHVVSRDLHHIQLDLSGLA